MYQTIQLVKVGGCNILLLICRCRMPCVSRSDSVVLLFDLCFGYFQQIDAPPHHIIVARYCSPRTA